MVMLDVFVRLTGLCEGKHLLDNDSQMPGFNQSPDFGKLCLI